MKKLILVFLFLPFISFSQERISLKGNVFDGVTFFQIEDANIYNFNSKKYSFTNKEGNFEILAKEGDTIIISKTIYRQILIEVTQEIIKKRHFDIAMYYKAILLREVNVFALPATYEAFKKEFVSVDFSNMYKLMDGISLTAEDINGAKKYPAGGLDLMNFLPKSYSSPITALYDKFSRKKKLERLYFELVENEAEVERLPLKYNRDLVTSLTGLNGEELLNFMMFCRFSYYELVRWTPEYIITQIKKKYGDYEFYKALEDN
jgi:hypothetical protein